MAKRSDLVGLVAEAFGALRGANGIAKAQRRECRNRKREGEQGVEHERTPYPPRHHNTALALLALLPLLVASGGFSPAAVKVAIPSEAWCLDAGATAQAWSYTTRPVLVLAGQSLGAVSPGSCAWLDGYVRRGMRVQLACGGALSAPAEWAAVPGGAALCAVPPDQDFR
jgi:hypothetical protein